MPWDRAAELGARLFCMPNTEEEVLIPGYMLFGTPKTDPAE